MGKFSDLQLIHWLKSDDEKGKKKAWTFIYKSYYPYCKKYVYSNGGTEDEAADVFQDSLLIFNKNVRNGVFKKESTIKTYLFSINRNLWLKRLREIKKMEQTEVKDDLSSEDEQYLFNTQIIADLLNQISSDCKTLLTEFYYNNKSMEELMQSFQLGSLQAVRTKKFRCISKLIALFKEKKIDYSQIIQSGNDYI